MERGDRGDSVLASSCARPCGGHAGRRSPRAANSIRSSDASRVVGSLVPGHPHVVAIAAQGSRIRRGGGRDTRHWPGRTRRDARRCERHTAPSAQCSGAGSHLSHGEPVSPRGLLAPQWGQCGTGLRRSPSPYHDDRGSGDVQLHRRHDRIGGRAGAYTRHRRHAVAAAAAAGSRRVRSSVR